MASGEGRRHRHDLVPLAALISKEMKNEKMEKPTVRYGLAALSRKGEDYFLIKTDCQRVPGNPSSTFSVLAIFDGHNGNAAAIFTREHLLSHVLSAVPRGLWAGGVASSFTLGISCWICEDRQGVSE